MSVDPALKAFLDKDRPKISLFGACLLNNSPKPFILELRSLKLEGEIFVFALISLPE